MTLASLSRRKNGDPVVPFFLAGLGGCRRSPGGFLDLSGPDAPGTHSDAFGLAVDDRPDALEVGIPAAIRLIVGVADVVSEDGALATDFTHSSHRSLHSQRCRRGDLS